MPQMKTGDREFRYQPRCVALIAGMVFCGICGYFTSVHAAANDRGLVINGLMELSRANATTFWWVVTWGIWSFIPLAALLVVLRFVNPQKLVLSGEGFYAAKWPWSPPDFIRYANIRNVSSYSVRDQPFLKIVHTAGKQTVAGSWLESTEMFEEFCGLLAQRMQAARGAVAGKG